MLYVLFGATTGVGRISRKWFVDHGVPIIPKKNYIPEGFPLTTFYEKRNTVSLEEVEACDYTYENNGMIVGFDKVEILDAVRGRCDRLLTGSAHNVEFVENIKRGFGEYVTTICMYIKQPVLIELTNALPNITADEVAIRTQMGAQIKRLLRDNRGLFDEILLFSGEGTAFDSQSLSLQLEQIVSRAKTLQKKLNDVHYVEAPYTGSKPYIFVSYAHADRPRIDVVLNRIQTNGCRVWYDDDMINRAGQDWKDIIFEKLRASTQCILFWSKNSAASKDVDAEMESIIRNQKPCIVVRVDEGILRESRESYIRQNQTLSLANDRFYEGLLKSIDKTVRTNG